MSRKNNSDNAASEFASKGGKARAKAMTPEERSESARKAVESRWYGDLPAATHGSPDHPLKIGDIEIPCYVLADGRRMLIQGGMLTGLDMSQGTASKGGSGDRLGKFITGKAINPFVPKKLRDMINNPVKFRTTSGSVAYGYEATVLADLCDAVLEARKETKLNYQTEHIAQRCEILVRGFARVGIIALVDAATGYEDIRPRNALAEILEKFVREEIRQYIKTFPLAYFREMCRLRNVPFSEKMKLPSYFGHLTNDLIYSRLAPGVLAELQRINPADNGRRKHKHFQHLTEDVGNPKLLQHLGSIVTLMKLSTGWDDLKEKVDLLHPVWTPMPLFDHLPDE